MVKLIVCAKRKPGITREEFGRYWRESHGPLVKSVSEFIRHVRKYVQCHMVSNSGPLGTGTDYDGIAELWYDSAEDVNRAFGGLQEARHHIQDSSLPAAAGPDDRQELPGFDVQGDAFDAGVAVA